MSDIRYIDIEPYMDDLANCGETVFCNNCRVNDGIKTLACCNLAKRLLSLPKAERTEERTETHACVCDKDMEKDLIADKITEAVMWRLAKTIENAAKERSEE